MHEDIIKVVSPQLEAAHCAAGVIMAYITAEHDQSTICVAFTLPACFVGTIMMLLLFHRPMPVCQYLGCHTSCQKFAMKYVNCVFLSQKLLHPSSFNNVC